MADLAFLSAPGVHFSPSDEECIYILQSKIQRNQLASHYPISYCDLYSNNEPWKIFNKDVKQNFYVFTNLKTMKNSKKNMSRTAGTGAWNMQRSEEVKNSSGQVIGYKKLLIFEVGKKGSTNSRTDGRWIMHEFSMIGQQCQDVLCKIRNKIMENVSPPLSISQYRLLQEEIQECSMPKIKFEQSKTDQKRRKLGLDYPLGIACVQPMPITLSTCVDDSWAFAAADTTTSWVQGNVGFDATSQSQPLSNIWYQSSPSAACTTNYYTCNTAIGDVPCTIKDDQLFTEAHAELLLPNESWSTSFNPILDDGELYLDTRWLEELLGEPLMAPDGTSIQLATSSSQLDVFAALPAESESKPTTGAEDCESVLTGAAASTMQSEIGFDTTINTNQLPSESKPTTGTEDYESVLTVAAAPTMQSEIGFDATINKNQLPSEYKPTTGAEDYESVLTVAAAPTMQSEIGFDAKIYTNQQPSSSWMNTD